MKSDLPDIETGMDSSLDQLCQSLSESSSALRNEHDWPGDQLKQCADQGVFRWFIDERWGGAGWAADRIQQGYIRLAAACLTTTFVITQRAGACRRIAGSDNEGLKQRLLQDLAAGSISATLGISHLTTSRRHLSRPVLVATQTTSGWTLNGFSPWVTGGANADYLVVAAVTQSGQQILVVVPNGQPGVTVQPGHALVALSASQTGAVEFREVAVPDEWVLSGPAKHVLVSGNNATTGGLQTSALALGLATAAVAFIRREAVNRPELVPNGDALQQQLRQLTDSLLSMARGQDQPECSAADLRTAANSFALRATQSALVAAKGAGFVAGHPVGRWCQEALFFLVWSCPQPVLDANLCEFAGLID